MSKKQEKVTEELLDNELLGIETFFDFWPTKKQIQYMTEFEEETKISYLNLWYEVCENDIEKVRINCYADLYRYFWWSGDKEKANEYADKIPDSNWKIFELMNHDHCVYVDPKVCKFFESKPVKLKKRKATKKNKRKR